MNSMARVFFADIAVTRIDPDNTLPAKFQRLLKRLKLSNKVKGKSVGIKMHFGDGTGYTTISPVFVRILVQTLKDGGAKSIKVMDNDPDKGIPRGYTPEVLGCEVVSTFGSEGKFYPENIGFGKLDTVLFGGEAVDCDFFIDFSHVKGHGACGFGGALKNIAMGVVPPEIRKKIHSLEGGITYFKEKCTFCRKCFRECRNNAIELDKEERQIKIFFHNCVYCQHCVMICPEKALEMEDRRFEDFSRGMALVAAKFLEKFEHGNLLFINFLLNITVFCDCWGMSTASLVPDIGIMVSDDIVAVETASLDMIKTENLLANGLPKGRILSTGQHLFEKIHAKDPYLMLKYLKEYYGGSEKYNLIEIK